MSCSFDVKKCINCVKYNGCLLQLIYKNTLYLASTIDKLSEKQQQISDEIIKIKSDYNVSSEDNLDLSTDLDEVLTKINNIDEKINEAEENHSEMNIDITQIKNSLALLDLKVDDIVQKYDYEDKE